MNTTKAKHSMNLAALATLLVSIIAGATTASADALISGTVTQSLAGYGPAPSARVQLYVGGKRVGIAYTDSRGAYSVPVGVSGVVTVVADWRGFSARYPAYAVSPPGWARITGINLLVSK